MSSLIKMGAVQALRRENTKAKAVRGSMMDNSSDYVTSSSDHPEEMKTVWDVRLGNRITLQGSASIRWTPRGVLLAGIATSAILLAVSAVVRAHRS